VRNRETPRNITIKGTYKAGSKIAYASGNNASSPPPPSTSQVSLASHTGRIDTAITLRCLLQAVRPMSMPTPRSVPSSTT
jgi:hypothetical protein